jgi:hypothetical protein
MLALIQYPTVKLHILVKQQLIIITCNHGNLSEKYSKHIFSENRPNNFNILWKAKN